MQATATDRQTFEKKGQKGSYADPEAPSGPPPFDPALLRDEDLRSRSDRAKGIAAEHRYARFRRDVPMRLWTAEAALIRAFTADKVPADTYLVPLTWFLVMADAWLCCVHDYRLDGWSFGTERAPEPNPKDISVVQFYMPADLDEDEPMREYRYTESDAAQMRLSVHKRR